MKTNLIVTTASALALFCASGTLAFAQTAAPAVQAVSAAGASMNEAATKMATKAAGAASAVSTPAATGGDVTEGKVAFYGKKFAGRRTASGEAFNPGALTMAHKTLPFGTLVKVTNLKNNKSVTVRVNDRGPSQPERVGDLSRAAASKIRMLRSGVIDAKLEVVGMSKMRRAAKAAMPAKAK